MSAGYGASGLVIRAMETCRIIYTSTAARLLGPAELDRLLLQARTYNFSEGISGLLLRAGPQFMQVLEGPHLAVAGLYARISADVRHTSVLLLEQAAVHRSLFPFASLAFAEVEPGALARLTAYLDPLHRRALLPRGYDEQAIIADLLLEFVEMHCPHLLGQAGPSAAGYPPGPPPAVAGPT